MQVMQRIHSACCGTVAREVQAKSAILSVLANQAHTHTHTHGHHKVQLSIRRHTDVNQVNLAHAQHSEHSSAIVAIENY